MAGLLTPEILGRVDADGRQLASEIIRIGGTNLGCDTVRSDADQILACLELHIEQAKLLETQGHDIGIVTTIPGRPHHPEAADHRQHVVFPHVFFGLVFAHLVG